MPSHPEPKPTGVTGWRPLTRQAPLTMWEGSTLNLIWTAMLVISVAFALLQGEGGAQAITQGVIDGAENAVVFAFGLVGILGFWCGILKVAEAAGFTSFLARLLSPLVRRLFPSIPPDDPANASILMAITVNLLGLGNAATPLGLKAMQELSRLNRGKDVASDAMCTFLAISTSGVTLLPATVIALRAAAGSAQPAAVVGTTLIATVIATAAALLADRAARRWGRPR